MRQVGGVPDHGGDGTEALFGDGDGPGELGRVVDVGDEGDGVAVVAEHERHHGGVVVADDGERDVRFEQGACVIGDNGVVVEHHQGHFGLGMSDSSHVSMMNPLVGDGLGGSCGSSVGEAPDRAYGHRMGGTRGRRHPSSEPAWRPGNIARIRQGLVAGATAILRQFDDLHDELDAEIEVLTESGDEHERGRCRTAQIGLARARNYMEIATDTLIRETPLWVPDRAIEVARHSASTDGGAAGLDSLEVCGWMLFENTSATYRREPSPVESDPPPVPVDGVLWWSTRALDVPVDPDMLVFHILSRDSRIRQQQPKKWRKAPIVEAAAFPVTVGHGAPAGGVEVVSLIAGIGAALETGALSSLRQPPQPSGFALALVEPTDRTRLPPDRDTPTPRRR